MKLLEIQDTDAKRRDSNGSISRPSTASTQQSKKNAQLYTSDSPDASFLNRLVYDYKENLDQIDEQEPQSDKDSHEDLNRHKTNQPLMSILTMSKSMSSMTSLKKVKSSDRDEKKSKTETRKPSQRPPIKEESKKKKLSDEDYFRSIERLSRSARANKDRSPMRFRTVQDSIKFDSDQIYELSQRLSQKKIAQNPVVKSAVSHRKYTEEDVYNITKRLLAGKDTKIPDSGRTMKNSDFKDNYLVASYAWNNYNI